MKGRETRPDAGRHGVLVLGIVTITSYGSWLYSFGVLIGTPHSKRSTEKRFTSLMLSLEYVLVGAPKYLLSDSQPPRWTAQQIWELDMLD